MIRLFKPTIKRKDMDSVLSTMVEEQVSPGSLNQELSARLDEEFGTCATLVIRSYPRAFILALQSLELEGQAPVAISALSPAIYLQLIEQAGYRPLLVDVDPRHGVITASGVAASGAEAVLLHQPLGNCADTLAISGLGLPVIEDLTESFGTVRQGRRAGDSATIVITSFEEDSFICAAGGAAISCRDKKTHARLQQLSVSNLRYDLLSDLNSALVLNQLKSLAANIVKRQELFEVCRSAVLKSRHQLINDCAEGTEHNCYTTAVLIDSRVREATRYVQKYKIETLMPFSTCALSMLGSDTTDFPNSVPFMLRAMMFPLYPMLSKDQLMTIVRVLSTLP